MTTNNPRSRKRNSGMGAVKTLIVSLGLALVFGFWGMFSRQNELTLLAETVPNVPITLLDQTTVRTVAIDLPPLPTLIPPLEMDPTNIIQPENVPVIRPQVQPNTTIFFNGSKPKSGGGSSSSSSSSAPAAVTVTRSSQ